jgi:hypothetical protein
MQERDGVLYVGNVEPRQVVAAPQPAAIHIEGSVVRPPAVRIVFDVRENIEGGVRHLVDRYRGNLTLALAAYNAGVDAVARHSGIPPYAETQAYVARILRLLPRQGLSVDAETAGEQEPQAARILLHRYEMIDGRIVYSNLPFDQLSSTVREMLVERQ